MKMNPLLLAAAVLLLGFVVMKTTEGFGTEAEFLDKKQVLKTVLTEDSSYSQQTNHMNPAQVSMGPIAGVESPFRVNMFNAYIL